MIESMQSLCVCVCVCVGGGGGGGGGRGGLNAIRSSSSSDVVQASNFLLRYGRMCITMTLNIGLWLPKIQSSMIMPECKTHANFHQNPQIGH